MGKASRCPQFVHDFTLGITPLLLGFNLLTFIGFFPHAVHGNADFRQIYAAAYMVRTGHSHELFSYEAQEHFQNEVASPQPYALPFIRPASQALLFVPLSLLSYPAAYCTFIGLNIFLVGVSFLLLEPWMRNLAVHSRWKPITVFLSFTPLAYGISQGQDTVLLLTLFSLCLWLIDRGRLFGAGFVLGIASFKFQFTIPILFLFLCWRRWKWSAGFTLGATILAIASVSITGLEQTGIYLRSLFAFTAGATSTKGLLQYAPGLPIAIMPNLHGLVHSLIGQHRASIIVFALLFTLITLWLLRAGWAMAPDKQFLAAVPAAIFLSYYSFMGDLTVLIPSLLVAFDRSACSGIVKRRLLLVSSAVLTLIAPACFWFFRAHFYLVSLPVLMLLLAITVNQSETDVRYENCSNGAANG